MSDEITSNPIEAPRPIEAAEGSRILKQMATVISVSVGGLVAFAFFLTPTRVAGATRSARLKWQQRQNELHQAVTASASSATNGPTTAENPAPPYPVSE